MHKSVLLYLTKNIPTFVALVLLFSVFSSIKFSHQGPVRDIFNILILSYEITLALFLMFSEKTLFHIKLGISRNLFIIGSLIFYYKTYHTFNQQSAR